VRTRPTELRTAPRIYVPWGATSWGGLSIVVRTVGDPAALTPAVRLLAESLEGDSTVDEVQTLEAHVEALGRPRRVALSVVGGFSLVALALSLLGLYGLLVGEVTARRQELGVRLTLGARPAQLLAATWWRGVRLAAVGLTMGLAAAPLIARAMSGMLVGVSVSDWIAPAASAVVLLLAAAGASLVPALRAARVDPASALRHS